MGQDLQYSARVEYVAKGKGLKWYNRAVKDTCEHLVSSCPATSLTTTVCLPLQVIVYVEDANDEAPVFTQQQYNRLGLRETAGIGTSVIVVRATDPDTGECCSVT